MRLYPAAFCPHEPIFYAGAFATSMYLIVRGIAGRRGRIVGAGSFMGEDIVLRPGEGSLPHCYSACYAMHAAVFDVGVWTGIWIEAAASGPRIHAVVGCW